MSIMPADEKFLTVKLLPNVAVDYSKSCALHSKSSKFISDPGYRLFLLTSRGFPLTLLSSVFFLMKLLFVVLPKDGT